MKLFKILLAFLTCTVNISPSSNTVAVTDSAKIVPKKVSITPKHVIVPPHTTLTPNHNILSKSATPKVPVAPLPKQQPPKSTATIPPQTQHVPYLHELQQADISQPIQNAWTALYEQCKTQNSNSQPFTITPEIEPLLTTDFFALMAQHLDPKTFAPLTNDPQGTIHTNYATVHVRQVMQRFSQIYKISIDPTSKQPSINFTGDVRDTGIIVNLQNNTDAQFALYQKSIDGTQSTQIGLIQPGMNALDVYTGALQTDKAPKVLNKKSGSAQQSNSTTTQYFQFQELNAVSPVTIDLKIMTGTQVIAFLKTLYRDPESLKKDTFEMNGLPTSPEFITNPNDWYLLLIQNPTPSTATQRDPQQRIQAINISKFSTPYLLTMQINQENVEITPTSHNQPAVHADVYQPLIQIIQFMKDHTEQKLLIPLIILPNFLDSQIQLKATQLLLNSILFTIVNPTQFFNVKTFGNQFQYFSAFNCFNNQNKYDFFIDLYNKFKNDYILYNASWLMANSLIETDLKHCTDMAQIYTAQDAYGHVIVNEKNFYYITFLAMFKPIVQEADNQNLFIQYGFNAAYAYPLNQLYTIIVNALTKDLSDGIFAKVIQVKEGVFQLTWTNKKNKIINSQKLYLHAQPSNIEITFANQYSNWVGSSVPADLLPLQINTPTDFKVTYEYSTTNDKHILLTQATSALDHQEVFLPLQFSEYPIQNLYIDLFHTINVKPFTCCEIIKNSVLPECLVDVTEQDWQSGIYMVPIIHNNEKITPQNPGYLSLAFYDPNKKLLGTFTTQGLYNNTTTVGIQEPVHAYAIHFSEKNCLKNLYLSTGVLLQYSNITS